MNVNGVCRDVLNGTVIYRWNILEPWNTCINAGLSTRRGGVSPVPFDSLNLGNFVGDSPENLKKNQTILSNAMQIPRREWVFPKQVHGNRITTANPESQFPECDAFLILSNRVAAAICLADCLPVVLYDPVQHIGALCHAGWRGTLNGVADAAVTAMLERGCRLENLVAAVGPGISSCCYPVSSDLAACFSPEQGYPVEVLTHAQDGTIRLNLEEANAWRLMALGMDEGSIGRSGICTACNLNDFFSYRKENGKTGRYSAVLKLR